MLLLTHSLPDDSRWLYELAVFNWLPEGRWLRGVESSRRLRLTM
jgi:hypothetical protein